MLIIIYKKLIKKLKSENFVFYRKYYNQKLDENNTEYISWLKDLYIKLYYPNDKFGIELKPLRSQNPGIPEYPILKENLEKNLFSCMNPLCNCVQ